MVAVAVAGRSSVAAAVEEAESGDVVAAAAAGCSWVDQYFHLVSWVVERRAPHLCCY